MRVRRSAVRLNGRRKPRVDGWLLFSLYFVCVVLLIISRLENDQLRKIRGAFTDLASPVLQAVSQPAIYTRRSKDQIVDYLDLFHELDRLKEENEKLKHWRWQAQLLERRMEHMRKLLNAVDQPALDYVTGNVIADARGPFARSVLVNLGRAQGVRNGYAVINGDGFVGHVVHSGDNASRVILANDLNSRVPVLVGPAGVRAVLVGDNSAEPRLEFLSDSSAVYEGDEVYTSGHGGMLPRGLQIGVVASGDGGNHRVRTHAMLGELEYVSVLFFNSPVVTARGKPPVMTGKADSPKGGQAAKGAGTGEEERHAEAKMKAQAAQ